MRILPGNVSTIRTFTPFSDMPGAAKKEGQKEIFFMVLIQLFSSACEHGYKYMLTRKRSSPGTRG